MSNKETTGDDLVASIRKTKSRSAATAASGNVKKKRSVTRSKKATPARTRTRPPGADKQVRPAGDNFQVGRRVWPD